MTPAAQPGPYHGRVSLQPAPRATPIPGGPPDDEASGHGDGGTGAPRRTAQALLLHPLLTVLGIAVLARVTLALISAALHGPGLFPDEVQYVELAGSVARGEGAEAWEPGRGQALYDSVWLYVAPLAAAFRIVGESRILGQLWAALFGAGTAVLTTWLALQVAPRRIALGAGLVVALFPSQVLWSALALRETLVWFALAAIAVSLAMATRRSRGWLLLVAGGSGALALASLGALRDQTLVAAALALAVSALVVPARERLLVAAGGLLVAVAVPALMGAGFLGLDYVFDVAPTLPERREALAEDANTALDEAALEDELASGVAVTLRPFPWEPSTSVAMGFARAESLAWYVLYAAALTGALVARSAWRVIAFPFFVTGALIGIAALSQGNLGTAFRHRGQVVWALVLMSTVAVVELQRRRCAAPSADLPVAP